MQGTMVDIARQGEVPAKNQEHYIPARPSVNIKMTPSGEVEIDLWQIADEMDRVENVTMMMPASTALEAAEAIIRLIKG